MTEFDHEDPVGELEGDMDAPKDGDYDRNRQRISLGVHPLGGVVLDVTDAYGRNAAMQLDPQLLGTLVLNLITINVVLTQQAQQAEQERMEAASKLWQPNQ